MSEGIILKNNDNVRVKRQYDVAFDLHAWLEEKADREGRSVIRQVEKIIEAARAEDAGKIGVE